MEICGPWGCCRQTKNDSINHWEVGRKIRAGVFWRVRQETGDAGKQNVTQRSERGGKHANLARVVVNERRSLTKWKEPRGKDNFRFEFSL